MENRANTIIERTLRAKGTKGYRIKMSEKALNFHGEPMVRKRVIGEISGCSG